MFGTDAIEDGRLNKKASGEAGWPATAGDELCALAFADFDVVLNRLELLRTDERSHLNVRIEAIPELPLRNPVGQPRDNLIGDRLLKNRAARGGAALACRSECTGDDAVHRKVEIRVLENDDRILAAHLTLGLHASRRTRRVDLRAVFG